MDAVAAATVGVPCGLRACPAYRQMVAGTRPRIACLPPEDWDALHQQQAFFVRRSRSRPAYDDVETFVAHRLLQRDLAGRGRVHYLDLDRGLLVVSSSGAPRPPQAWCDLVYDLLTRVLGVAAPLSIRMQVYPMTAPCAFAAGAVLTAPASERGRAQLPVPALSDCDERAVARLLPAAT